MNKAQKNFLQLWNECYPVMQKWPESPLINVYYIHNPQHAREMKLCRVMEKPEPPPPHFDRFPKFMFEARHSGGENSSLLICEPVWRSLASASNQNWNRVVSMAVECIKDNSFSFIESIEFNGHEPHMKGSCAYSDVVISTTFFEKMVLQLGDKYKPISLHQDNTIFVRTGTCVNSGEFN